MMIYGNGDHTKEDAARLRVVRYFSDLCSELEPSAEKQARAERVRQLELLTDEELAELGLLREDIVDFVFRDAHFV